MNKRLKIGVLGCSSFGMRSMVPTIKEMGNEFELVAISSRRIEKAKKYAKIFDIQYTFDSYQQLIDLEGLDAVYIPLPNALHFQWVKIAIEKSLHVLVEKPMALTYDQVKYLNDLALQNECVLVENFHFRFHKQLEFIQKAVNDGIIGELRCVKSSFGFPPFVDKANIRYQKELGGGSLFDAGVYPIKIVQLFLGGDIEVSAANLDLDIETQIDVWGGAYLKQKSGSLFAQISFGFDNFYQCNLELWGSKGRIYANRIFTAPPELKTKIIIETLEDRQEYKMEACNHFEKILTYFYQLINSEEQNLEEYAQNINQARLVSEVMKNN